jgi:thiol-disulfide isomerase/thioredoxin
VKKIHILLLTAILLFTTGCSDKKSDTSTDSNTKIEKEKTPVVETKQKTDFILSDNNDTNYTIEVDNKNIKITNVTQKIVILNLFSTWCTPCKGEIPYIADLKKKYDNKIFVAGILVNDSIAKEDFENFKKELHINYFTSTSSQNDEFAKLIVANLKLKENFPLPLTIMFKNGKYYSHYEGAVPLEMLSYDINNAMDKE